MLSILEVVIWAVIILASGVGVGWAIADYWLHKGPWLDLSYHSKKRGF